MASLSWRAALRNIVDQVFQIRTGETGVPRAMMLKSTSEPNCTLPAWTLRICSRPAMSGVDIDIAVETTGADQRRVQNVETVGGGDDDDFVVGGKTIHFDENCIEGLFALVVTAGAGATTAFASYSVNFINENNTGLFSLAWVNKSRTQQHQRPRTFQQSQNLRWSRTEHRLHQRSP